MCSSYIFLIILIFNAWNINFHDYFTTGYENACFVACHNLQFTF